MNICFRKSPQISVEINEIGFGIVAIRPITCWVRNLDGMAQGRSKL